VQSAEQHGGEPQEGTLWERDEQTKGRRTCAEHQPVAALISIHTSTCDTNPTGQLSLSRLVLCSVSGRVCECEQRRRQSLDALGAALSLHRQVRRSIPSLPRSRRGCSCSSCADLEHTCRPSPRIPVRKSRSLLGTGSRLRLPWFTDKPSLPSNPQRSSEQRAASSERVPLDASLPRTLRLHTPSSHPLPTRLDAAPRCRPARTDSLHADARHSCCSLRRPVGRKRSSASHRSLTHSPTTACSPASTPEPA